MDKSPLTAADLALSEAMDARQRSRFTEAKVDLLINMLTDTGILSVCGICMGRGCVPPATRVPCECCNGAGRIPNHQGIDHGA